MTDTTTRRTADVFQSATYAAAVLSEHATIGPVKITAPNAIPGFREECRQKAIDDAKADPHGAIERALSVLDIHSQPSVNNAGAALRAALETRGWYDDPQPEFPLQFYVENAEGRQLTTRPVTCDSMAPMLNPGDWLLVDIATRYRTDAVCIVEYDDDQHVRRVQWLPDNRARLIRDNRRYPSDECSANDFKIVGVVVAVARVEWLA